MAAVLPQRVVARVSELIFSIMGLLLDALRGLCICLFGAERERGISRPRSSSPSRGPRLAFVNYPPSAWAAP